MKSIVLGFILLFFTQATMATKMANYFVENQASLDLGEKPSLLVLVHGINASFVVFDPLQEYLIGQGFKTVQYRYDYNQNMETSSNEFSRELKSFAEKRNIKNVIVLAHSIGGLMARRSMVLNREESLANSNLNIRLISVATPFGGYPSANIQYFKPLRVLARLFGGKESHGNLGTWATYIKTPGALPTNVSQIKIETLEEDKLRRNDSGRYEKDTVAGVKNQKNKIIDTDPQLLNTYILDEGHDSVINNSERKPSESLLQLLPSLLNP